VATSRKQCAATRADGQPCRAPALPGEALCFAHSPSQAASRAAARARGGQSHSNAARLARLVPPRLTNVFDVLETALSEVREGTISPPQASAMAALGRALVAVMTAGELEARLRDLEQRAAASERAR
jgi:hypothetical protein